MLRAWLLALAGVAVAVGPSAAQPAAPVVEAAAVAQRLAALLPAQVLILGEQHDAESHQALQAAVVRELAGRGQLRALVLEMAARGHDTAALPPDANAAAARQALAWEAEGWPWERYAPVVMAAVRAGVPVHGGNLPRAALRAAMTDASLDAAVDAAHWPVLQTLIHQAHCEWLPASQLPGMARVQIGRDRAMAETVLGLLEPGRVVLLVAGRQHARGDFGVPWHLLRQAPALQGAVRVVDLRTPEADPLVPPGSAWQPDAVWPTPAAPPQDHCAALRQRFQRPGAGSGVAP